MQLGFNIFSNIKLTKQILEENFKYRVVLINVLRITKFNESLISETSSLLISEPTFSLSVILPRLSNNKLKPNNLLMNSAVRAVAWFSHLPCKRGIPIRIEYKSIKENQNT